MKNQTHSPLPQYPSDWYFQQTGGNTYNISCKGYENEIKIKVHSQAGHHDKTPNIAHLITLAANNHKALKGALFDLLNTCRDSSWAHIENGPCSCKGCSIRQGFALLAKIKEEERQ